MAEPVLPSINGYPRSAYGTIESRVYHLDAKCPHLNRRNRYWPIDIISNARMVAGHRTGPYRPCRRCGNG